MSNDTNWCGMPVIGHVSETGAVYVGNDRFVSQWVIEGAPFTHRESKGLRAIPGKRTIVNKRGELFEYGLEPEAAQQQVDRLNELAALAMLLKGATHE